jgi:hypothetical protein
MALHRKAEKPFIQNFGDKVRQGVEIAQGLKGLWDTGRAIYGGIQTIAPYIATAAAAL